MLNFKKGNTAVIVAIVAAVVLVIGFLTFRTTDTPVETPVSAVPSSVTNSTISSANDIYTGVNATSTSATSYTLVQKDIQGYGTILITPTVNSLTLTLPATSTLSQFLPKAGSRTTIFIVNATSTAAKTVTIAAGTGTLLKNATTTAAIGPGSVGRIDLVRKTDTDIDVLLDIGI